jgi:hypothetical protein
MLPLRHCAQYLGSPQRIPKIRRNPTVFQLPVPERPQTLLVARAHTGQAQKDYLKRCAKSR